MATEFPVNRNLEGAEREGQGGVVQYVERVVTDGMTTKTTTSSSEGQIVSTVATDRGMVRARRTAGGRTGQAGRSYGAPVP